MSDPLVVIDADVLGRQRTGDETYMLNLLRGLGPAAAGSGLRLAAVTRHPELVPHEIEALELSTGRQEARMAWTLPRLLRRVGAALVHTQYAIPLRAPCPAVVTIHDLSFERDPELMSRVDRIVFRRVVPRAAANAVAVLTVSERSRADLVELYGVDPARIVVTPNGVDSVFEPGEGGPQDYVLSVGSIEPRKNQLAAALAAREAGLPLVVAGPVRDAALAAELQAAGATLRGYVPLEALVSLYRGAACLVQVSRYEGFGLPVVEAMACGTPVVVSRDSALLEIAGGAAVVVEGTAIADGILRAVAERETLVAAGLRRAAEFSWAATAAATLGVYAKALKA